MIKTGRNELQSNAQSTLWESSDKHCIPKHEMDNEKKEDKLGRHVRGKLYIELREDAQRDLHQRILRGETGKNGDSRYGNVKWKWKTNEGTTKI